MYSHTQFPWLCRHNGVFVIKRDFMEFGVPKLSLKARSTLYLLAYHTGDFQKHFGTDLVQFPPKPCRKQSH